MVYTPLTSSGPTPGRPHCACHAHRLRRPSLPCYRGVIYKSLFTEENGSTQKHSGEICKRSLKFLQTCLFHYTTLIRSVAQFSLTEGRNSSPCGRNALFCVRRYHCALSGIVFSISDITVDAIVDRYVSSGISGAQRRESEFLRELSYVCHLFSARVILRH